MLVLLYLMVYQFIMIMVGTYSVDFDSNKGGSTIVSSSADSEFLDLVD